MTEHEDDDDAAQWLGYIVTRDVPFDASMDGNFYFPSTDHALWAISHILGHSVNRDTVNNHLLRIRFEGGEE